MFATLKVVLKRHPQCIFIIFLTLTINRFEIAFVMHRCQKFKLNSYFHAMDNYQFLEKIGSGSHGTVYLLKSEESEKFVVCKTFIPKFKMHAQREIAILEKITHRRIVTMIESISHKDSIYIILEYINFGSLDSMIQFFIKNNTTPSNSLGWSVLSQMADVLYYLQSKKIIHRDLKPSNILISRFYVKSREYLEFKLCDFSLATKAEDKITDKHVVGTPFYMSPEMVSRTEYDHTVDVWGLGCCVLEVLSLTKPFKGKNREELFQKILNDEPEGKVKDDMLLASIIKECLEKKDRINSRALIKYEKIRLQLTMLELRLRENRIEQLENRLNELENRNIEKLSKEISKY